MSRWNLLWIIPIAIIFIIAIGGSVARVWNVDHELAENQKLCPEGYSAGISKYGMDNSGLPVPKYNDGVLEEWVDCTKITTEKEHYNKDIKVIRKQ